MRRRQKIDHVVLVRVIQWCLLCGLINLGADAQAQRPGGRSGLTSGSSESGIVAGTERRPDYLPEVYAIVGADLVVAPGRTIENGTVVVRRGVIEAVGTTDEVEVPYDAETIEGEGLTVYAGFIDLYTNIGASDIVPRSSTGLGRPIELSEFAQASTPPDNRNGLTPEFRVAEALSLPDSTTTSRRNLGFTSLLAAPDGAIATGQSALVSLGGLGRRESILAEPIALHINLSNPRGRQYGLLLDAFGIHDDEYCAGHGHSPEQEALLQFIQEAMAEAGPPDSGGFPGALMGVIAHLRQAMIDAEYHHECLEYYAFKGGPRPPYDPALETLHDARTGSLPTWWEAESRDEIHRVLDLAKEFGTTATIVGGTEAHKVIDRLKATESSVVLRIDFDEEPEVPTETEYRKKKIEERDQPLRSLQHAKDEWDERIGLAEVLDRESIPFAFTTDGLSRTTDYLEKIRTMIDAGLSTDAALRALTIEAARLAGVEQKVGTIEPGKLGHLVVWSDRFESEGAKPRVVLIDGLKFEIDDTARPSRPGDETDEKPDATVVFRIAEDSESELSLENAELVETALGEIEGVGGTESEIVDGKLTVSIKFGDEVQDQPVLEAIKAGLNELRHELPDGVQEPIVALAEAGSPHRGRGNRGPSRPRTRSTESEESELAESEVADDDTPFSDVATELDEDRMPTLKTGGDVLIKNATILPVTSESIAKGSVLILDGKFAEIGTDIEAPEDVTVIDAEGMVALPGVIDTHSHMAISGGVNEGSLSIVPEVRIKDVVTGDDSTIYRAAAGGVTAARLLHGSANTIGGQDGVIKLKYGNAARDLIIADGPQGIKFALGENVTRKRSSNPERFPFTRPGVEAVLIRAFDEALAYKAKRRAYAEAIAAGETPPPFRRDLRLESIAAILDGEIKIHSHCYRADEILMLLRTAERYGIRVQSLQHVLEGYKIAAEIAEHGASNSTFSDWYAYKVEAYDAIPHNAALLTKAGANVCIKSDSGEEIRHLPMEAAKMVRYGGLSEREALALVTINPARELGLDHRLGSIEVGKDADLALYDAHPLDGFAQCQLTLVDGEVVFQRFNAEGSPLLRPREGEHTSMPIASEQLRNQTLAIDLNPTGKYALTNGTIHPVSAPTIEGGTVIIESGLLTAVGGIEISIPEGATTIDLGGLDVWPGMIDAGTDLGLNEIGSISATQDVSELASYQPELRAAVAINPDSMIIGANRLSGVLTSFIRPTGGTISGQGCLADLFGWTWAEMVQDDELALYVNLPPAPPANLDAILQRVPAEFAARFRERFSNREKRLEEMKDQFRKALDFGAVVDAAIAHGDHPPVDPRLAALVPYARGEKPVVLAANGRGEILTAIKIANELEINAIISGGADAWMIAVELANAKVPVLISGTHRTPGSNEPYDAPYANPARLLEAGVTFAISSSGDASEGRNLPFEAAMASAYGLPVDEAVKAVTLSPALILGVDDRYGSIEAGKRANLVIAAGHLLQPTTEVKYLFVGGRPIPPESRQTELYERYCQRLQEVHSGISPLGLDRPTSEITKTPGSVSGPASQE